MDQGRVNSIRQEMEQRIRLANEQIRHAEEDYARKMEEERNRDANENLP